MIIENYYKSIAEVPNPNLDKDKFYTEQLVSCRCGFRFRLKVNMRNPACDTKMKNIICPACHSLAGESWISISGHSGGFFNASVRKL